MPCGGGGGLGGGGGGVSWSFSFGVLFWVLWRYFLVILMGFRFWGLGVVLGGGRLLGGFSLGGGFFFVGRGGGFGGVGSIFGLIILIFFFKDW